VKYNVILEVEGWKTMLWR